MTKSLGIQHFLVIMTAVLAMSIPPAPVYAEQMVTATPINVGIVGEEDFDAGYIVIPRVPIYWQSDVPWRLTVSSLEPNLGSSADARGTKSLGDLQWRISDQHSWQPMSQDTGEVAWSANTGSGVVYIDIMVLLSWLKDAPGDYHTDLMFTIEPL